MTLNYDIPPSGPTDAQIILIGEAPASEEYIKGECFVGSAGRHLDKLLTNAGLHRGSLYITNVSKEQAPSNKIAKMPFDRLCLWKADLIDEINLLPNPKILVPLGNYALETITGRSGITNLRGSVLHPTSRIKHDCIVIPTFHPSKLHYDYTAWPLIVADFMRIKKIADSDFDFQFPAYSFILKPTFSQVMETLEKLEKMNDTLMTIDVETPHRLLSCFSIAWSRSDAICIPFFWGTGRDYWTIAEEVAIWQRLSKVLPKLNLTNQNVLFDWSILLQHGIRLKIPKFDSMLMHSCLYSELPHRLEIITSIYTDVEFYKRDEKEEKGSSLKAGQEMAHWRYCCYDSVAALWSIEELLKELVEENMIDPYLNLFADLIEPIFLMNITGIKADLEKLKIVRKDIKKSIKTVDATIEQAVGHELNVKSPKQVAATLFDELNMVGYKDRQTGKVTTSEKDLIKLAHKYQIDLPLLIVKNRKDYKLLSLFAEENIDDDGRIRCQYSLTRTKTGRIASKKSFSGRGMNLQNVKREGPARSFFVPEKGHVMIGADQKNAEAQMMAWLSRDEALLEIFASGKSLHIENARNLFGKYVDKKDPLYTIGKGLLFGANYGIGPWAFARNANLPYPEAKMKLALYYATYPNIKDVFWKYVEEQLKESRTLYNPFGRRQIFFDRLNEATLRAGYAFIPQSTVTDINKIALKRIYKQYLPVLEVHDGLIISVPKNEVKKGIQALRDAYDVEFEVWDEKHIIPVEVSIGSNWHDMKEIE